MQRADDGDNQAPGAAGQAPLRPGRGPLCLPLELLRRETGARHRCSHNFRTPQWVGEYDVYQPRAGSSGGGGGGEELEWPPFYMRRRSRVVEVVVEGGLLLALADSGVCAVFSVGSPRRLGFLNVEADEIIRCIFLNRPTQELLTVSVYSADNYRGLRCRATPLRSIREGRAAESRRRLFGGENLAWPGFVEFDDNNSTALTYCSVSRLYKVWDMTHGYRLQCVIRDKRIRLIRIGDAGVALVALQPSEGLLPIQIRSLADATILKEFSVPLGGTQELEVLELFERYLLVRLAGGPLSITDICSGAQSEVPAAEFRSPQDSAFCRLNRCMLAFFVDRMEARGVCGRRLGALPGCAPPPVPNHGAVLLHLSLHETHMVVVSRVPGGAVPSAGPQEQSAGGSGSSAAPVGALAQQAQQGEAPPAVPPPLPREQAGECCCLGVVDLQRCQWVARLCTGNGCAGGAGVAEERQRPALESVTALFFDEARRTIYTGTTDGHVHAWSC